MRRFWLFRSDLTELEYYHQYKSLDKFKENCHDYYMLLPLWLLENDYFDEVIIWRLNNNHPDIVFDIDGKKYIQKWVNNFSETLSFPSPEISFWRGGFKAYDQVTRQKPKHFGLKLYLGAGRRILPQWGGIYDVFLMEDEDDFLEEKKCLPFYKTASPYIFHPIANIEKEWDICWPCNFTQLKFKGQEEFIKLISRRPKLKEYKIIHCGNKPGVGRGLCRKYNVKNIEFLGHVDRPKLNKVLNQSKFGLNLSNLMDGCPRVSTEVLMSGTPLFLKDTVRLLSYFKTSGVIEISDASIVARFEKSFRNYEAIKKGVLEAIETDISFDKTCQKNIKLWQKI
jgi:glycosyltransferase involved in cell wall biosynthesis